MKTMTRKELFRDAILEALTEEKHDAIRTEASLPRGQTDHVNGVIAGLKRAVKIVQEIK